MAHIISDNVIIKAILTKAGRERLSSGVDKFNITKFALSDDEIDYTTQDLKQEIIEAPDQFPILQPILDGKLMMRSRLYTDFNINQGVVVLAYIQLNGGNYTEQETINFNSTLGTEFTLNPSTIGSVSQGYNITIEVVGDMPFSSMNYWGKNLGGTPTNIPIVNSQKIYPISGATKFNGIIKSIGFPTILKVDIVGVRTGAMASYTFKFPVNTSLAPVTPTIT